MLCVLVIGNFVEMDLDWLLWLIAMFKHTLNHFAGLAECSLLVIEWVHKVI